MFLFMIYDKFLIVFILAVIYLGRLNFRPFIRPQKVFSDFNEICRQRSMSDTRRYVVRPDQGRSHGSPKVAKMANFKVLFSPPV